MAPIGCSDIECRIDAMKLKAKTQINVVRKFVSEYKAGKRPYGPLVDEVFDFKYSCETGYHQVKLMCTPCGPGYYSRAEELTCHRCPKNTFQDKYGGAKCVRCPLNKKTTKTGAKFLTDCDGLGRALKRFKSARMKQKTAEKVKKEKTNNQTLMSRATDKVTKTVALLKTHKVFTGIAGGILAIVILGLIAYCCIPTKKGKEKSKKDGEKGKSKGDDDKGKAKSSEDKKKGKSKGDDDKGKGKSSEDKKKGKAKEEDGKGKAKLSADIEKGKTNRNDAEKKGKSSTSKDSEKAKSKAKQESDQQKLKSKVDDKKSKDASKRNTADKSKNINTNALTVFEDGEKNSSLRISRSKSSRTSRNQKYEDSSSDEAPPVEIIRRESKKKRKGRNENNSNPERQPLLAVREEIPSAGDGLDGDGLEGEDECGQQIRPHSYAKTRSAGLSHNSHPRHRTPGFTSSYADFESTKSWKRSARRPDKSRSESVTNTSRAAQNAAVNQAKHNANNSNAQPFTPANSAEETSLNALISHSRKTFSRHSLRARKSREIVAEGKAKYGEGSTVNLLKDVYHQAAPDVRHAASAPVTLDLSPAELGAELSHSVVTPDVVSPEYVDCASTFSSVSQTPTNFHSFASTPGDSRSVPPSPFVLDSVPRVGSAFPSCSAPSVPPDPGEPDYVFSTPDEVFPTECSPVPSAQSMLRTPEDSVPPAPEQSWSLFSTPVEELEGQASPVPLNQTYSLYSTPSEGQVSLYPVRHADSWYTTSNWGLDESDSRSSTTHIPGTPEHSGAFPPSRIVSSRTEESWPGSASEVFDSSQR